MSKISPSSQYSFINSIIFIKAIKLFNTNINAKRIDKFEHNTVKIAYIEHVYFVLCFVLYVLNQVVVKQQLSGSLIGERGIAKIAFDASIVLRKLS